MSRQDRAAQFSPFAALTGHDAAIDETARTTQERIEISDDVRQDISGKLACVVSGVARDRRVRITWFMPDARKTGGSYVQSVGVVRRLDSVTHVLTLDSGEKIPVADVTEVSFVDESASA